MSYALAENGREVAVAGLYTNSACMKCSYNSAYTLPGHQGGLITCHIVRELAWYTFLIKYTQCLSER